MDPFSPSAPEWSKPATHAFEFCCPQCHSGPLEAQGVWINRRSPVYGEDYRKKWQEFYHCSCGTAWWAWSSDRPPSELCPKVEGEEIEALAQGLRDLLDDLETLNDPE